MKSNLDRRKEIFNGVLPSKGTEAYEKLKAYHKNRVQTPEEKKFFKDCFTKARNSLEAQHTSHSNFITEITLRHFLMEYNTRAWEHGLRSMPLLFNIMEAFFIYRKPHIYFELLEEENYLISFFDFLDFVTSQDFSNDESLIQENLVEDIIYNFNVGADLKEITFKTEDSVEYIITGVSLIRRKNEVTVLLITGSNEKKTISAKDIKLETQNPDKKDLLNQFNSETEELNNEPLYIDNDGEYSKVLIVCRIDLDSNTIDARYVAEEYERLFKVITDESDGFTKANGEYLSEEYEELHKSSVKKIESFGAIMEVAKASLYLPYFLNIHDEELMEESHDTEFKKLNSNPIRKRKFKDTFGYKTSIKPLYVLNTNNKFSPDSITLRDDLFKIETSGYWKKLGADETGLNKKGEPIHGKTWVNKKLSWFEGTNEDLIVKKDSKKFSGENAGFIYIIRNPTMENNVFKIGLTTKKVEERIKQLSKTSVPDKFYKAQEWNVADCVTAEKRIHELLKEFRVDPRREFFEVDYSTAVEVISNVCNEINENNA
jgi:hypothetical protein